MPTPTPTERLHVRRPQDYPGPFQVMHTNVDGAGFFRDADGSPSEWPTLAEAHQAALSSQESVMQDGNPWGYAHHVWDATWNRKLYTFS